MLCPPDQGKEKTAWLNGLRGIAALIVAFTHFIAGEINVGFRAFFADPPEENRRLFQLPPFRIIFADQAMVALFFIVSAYSISIGPLKLRDNAPREKLLSSLASSVFRRPIRLYAPVIALEGISYSAFYLGLYPIADLFEAHLHSIWDHVAHLWRYMLDIIYPFTPLTQLPLGLNVQIWTIPAEFRGSCIVYLLILCTSNTTPIVRLVIYQLVGLLGVWKLDWVMFTFMCGLTISELRSILDARQIETLPSPTSIPKRKCTRMANGLLFVFGFYLLCIPEQPTGDPWSLEYWLLGALNPSDDRTDDVPRMWRSLGGAMCIWAIDSSPTLQAPFNTAIIQYLGKISFGLYLVHIMIYRICRDKLIRFFWGITGSDDAFGWIGAAVVLTPVVWWAAHTFYRVVDKRSITLARWLDSKLRGTSQAQPPVRYIEIQEVRYEQVPH